MYATLYNRLCGWLLIAVSLAGYAFGHLGDYVAVTATESSVSLVLGVIAIAGARSRPRYAIPTALLVGIVLTLLGVWGILDPNNVIGSAEPLESALRIVTGGWGLYVAIQDFFAWRRRPVS